MHKQILGVVYLRETSFLFAFLGVLFALAGRSLVCSFFLLGFFLGLEGCFLLFQDFFVLLDGFRVHLDGSMTESTVVAIPVLSHEGTWSAGGASFALLGDVSFT